jgi:hypothetical protein
VPTPKFTISCQVYDQSLSDTELDELIANLSEFVDPNLNAEHIPENYPQGLF